MAQTCLDVQHIAHLHSILQYSKGKYGTDLPRYNQCSISHIYIAYYSIAKESMAQTCLDTISAAYYTSTQHTTA